MTLPPPTAQSENTPLPVFSRALRPFPAASSAPESSEPPGHSCHQTDPSHFVCSEDRSGREEARVYGESAQRAIPVRTALPARAAATRVKGAELRKVSLIKWLLSSQSQQCRVHFRLCVRKVAHGGLTIKLAKQQYLLLHFLHINRTICFFNRHRQNLLASQERISHLGGQAICQIQDAALANIFRFCTHLANLRRFISGVRPRLPSEIGEGSATTLAPLSIRNANHSDIRVISETRLAQDRKLVVFHVLDVRISLYGHSTVCRHGDGFGITTVQPSVQNMYRKRMYEFELEKRSDRGFAILQPVTD